MRLADLNWASPPVTLGAWEVKPVQPKNGPLPAEAVAHWLLDGPGDVRVSLAFAPQGTTYHLLSPCCGRRLELIPEEDFYSCSLCSLETPYGSEVPAAVRAEGEALELWFAHAVDPLQAVLEAQDLLRLGEALWAFVKREVTGRWARHRAQKNALERRMKELALRRSSSPSAADA